MPDKFILERKSTFSYKQSDKYPKIRIPAETYDSLADICAETGLPMTRLVTKMVDFATKRLVFIDPFDDEK